MSCSSHEPNQLLQLDESLHFASHQRHAPPPPPRTSQRDFQPKMKSDMQTQALAKRASLSDYGAVNDARNGREATKPLLPPRAASEVVRPSWAAAPIMRQSSSVRALLRVTSVVQESSRAEAAKPHPLRSLAGSQRLRPESAPMLRRSATTTNIPPILRAMSSIFEPKPVEKFRCYICFDDTPVTESVTLTSCGHRYCQSCFQSYLSIKINEGHVHPVCFHPVDQVKEVINADEENPAITMQKTCGVAVSDQQIESIVDTEVWAKFNRFRFNQEHEHARECPYCTFTQECVGPSNPTCVCGQCGKAFCFFHGNAHEDGTCADYELKNAETDASSRAKIDEISKPCPGCKRDVEKDGGCNHMKCVACETSFCWLCGEIIEDIPMPVHFQASSGSACSGKQFDGDSDVQIPWWALAYAMVLFLVCYPFAFVTALAIAPFAWCFASSPRPSVFFQFAKWNTLAMIFYSLLFSFVFFLTMLIVETTLRLAWYIIKLPFRAVAFVLRPVLCCCRPRAVSSETVPEAAHVDLESGLDHDAPKEPATHEENGRAYAA